MKNVKTPNRRIFFRHSALILLAIHKVWLRRIALIGGKISRRWAFCHLSNKAYFYLTAFLEDKANFDNPDDLFPTIYRIDRIRSFKVLNEHFQVPYKNRFEEGEFRKRVQFMYGGKLEHIKFRYTGPSIEAVLDRLPMATATKAVDEGWTIEAEVFGKGIEMWLRSQGDYIERLEMSHESGT